jgi:hypothetical protein
VVGANDVVGPLVTVTVLVLVLVLVDGGGTAVVVVIVVTVVVVVAAAAMTPQASRLPGSAVALPKLSAFWWMISAVPEPFLRSAAVNKFVVVTSFAEPSERTCNAVRSPLAG